MRGVIDQTFSAICAHSKAFFTKQPIIIKYIVFLFYYVYYLIFGMARVRRGVKLFKYSGMIYFQNTMKIYEDWFLFLFETIVEQRIKFQKRFKVAVEPVELVSEIDGKIIDIPLPQSKSIECFLYMKNDKIKQVRYYYS